MMRARLFCLPGHRCEALTKLPGPTSPPFCWKPAAAASHCRDGLLETRVPLQGRSRLIEGYQHPESQDGKRREGYTAVLEGGRAGGKCKVTGAKGLQSKQLAASLGMESTSGSHLLWDLRSSALFLDVSRDIHVAPDNFIFPCFSCV
eukprot:712307-Pelagomonas_calceolata.AAC.1